MIYLLLFYEFFKIGLFSVGGGLATVPFLYDLAEKYPWFTAEGVADMIAISESTPGPIGINMATYAGYNAAGLGGSVTAMLAIALPGILIVMIVAAVLTRFKQSRLVQSAFYGIRPAVTGLISAACLAVMKVSLFRYDAFVSGGMDWSVLINLKAALLFAALLFLIRKYKKHPVVYIAGAAVLGVLIPF